MTNINTLYRAVAIAVMVVMVPTHALAERIYLDDANVRKPVEDPSVPKLDHDFPRTLAHEFAGSATDEAFSKYNFIDAHGTFFSNVENVQSTYSPSTLMLRHISGRAYQSYDTKYCYISGGVAFETTTDYSQGGPNSAGCGIYAGHWLYQAGATLTANRGPAATTLNVSDAARFKVGSYVVIYDAPAGSFANAEHARVTAVDKTAKTIDVVRGYKSAGISRVAGAIVAQHVLGQGVDKKLWAFNLTKKSPRDGQGKTFGEFYADWLGQNFLRYKNGIRTSANVVGVMFDADFYVELETTLSDADNDLVVDNGIGPGGENWLGKGLDDFYARVSAQLPGKYVLAGVHRARGVDTTYGTQIEGWVDYGSGDFNPVPEYSKLDEMFAYYLYHMAEHQRGPALVHNLTKTPTKEYPGKSGSAATSNSPSRLGLALTLMEDGYFGTHSEQSPDAWWDEYAVNVVPESPNYGKAIAKDNINGIYQHRGWLGKPVGKFSRIYDDADFVASKSLLANGTFDVNADNWRADNVSISHETTGQQDGAAAIHISAMHRYSGTLNGASVKSEQLTVTKNQPYTLAFSMRSSAHRDVRIALGDAETKVPVSENWRRYVVTLVPSSGGTTAVKFNLGVESTEVWLDSVYLFPGNVNVFRREFDNGLVLANATPNSRVISVGPGYQRIDGTQDPTFNNGNAATSITLAPYDAILLVRSEAAPGPIGGTGQIGDLVWRDTDADGMKAAAETGWAGLTVKLRQCNGPVLSTTTTDADGQYLFQDLAAGNYQVEFVRPSNADYSPFSGGVGSGPDNSDVDPATGLTWCISITAAGETRLSLDAGMVPTSGSRGTGTSSIGDYVWNDANHNGIQGPAELGLADVQIKLRSCNGIFLQTKYTDAYGNYEFSDLEPGNYTVQFITPIGATPSPSVAGTDSTRDSDPDASGMTQCRTLKDNDQRVHVDAGFYF